MRLLCFFILVFALTIGSCTGTPSNSEKQKNSIQVSKDTVQSPAIPDTLSYATFFLSQLKDYPGEVKIEGSYIVAGIDTTYFPNDLKALKSYVFRAVDDSISLLLKVKRINLTTLEYWYEERSLDRVLYLDSGEAMLKPFFFLASEVDEDDVEGISYGASEYAALGHPHNLSLRMGLGRDHQERLRARVHYERKGSLKEQDIYPTLRTEKNP